ncbi:MAG: lamin tail domain-containing protein, partial [Sedimentisphaerales bacterium]|nr:lamin tail domain-containing protein [Sedimentisphaerales bacterium]
MNIPRDIPRIKPIVILLALLAGPSFADLSEADWIAYNDCVYRSLDQYIEDNVTTFGVGNNYTGPTSGMLLDAATGQATGVTVTLTESGGVIWQADPAGAGSDTFIGTDAYNTFHGYADMMGVIYYGSVNWYVDLTFTGLDPLAQYTFVTSACRNAYTDRLTIYTISGADAFTNESTPGVDILADNRVRFNTGGNYNEGYVARWTGITAPDGSFTVRAEADPASPEGRRAYAFDVFLLAQTDSSANHPPKVDAGADRILTMPLSRLTLDASVTDDGQGDPNGFLRLEWSQVDGPAAVRFEPNAFVEDPVARLPQIGNYLLELYATDGALEATDQVAVSIVESICPIGDLDGDCRVDLADVQILLAGWMITPASQGDLDGDDLVNLVDYTLLAENWLQQRCPEIVINEIHSNPDVKTELIEFVELYNPWPKAVDLAGWYFSEGIDYVFPADTVIPADGYLVVAEDPLRAYLPITLEQKYGVPAEKICGPFAGSLENDGERIVLRNAQGVQIDAVDYRLGFPWPTVGDPMPASQPGKGHSIQLLNPRLDNDQGGHWRSAYPTPAAPNAGVYADNTPPLIRQVDHEPDQPVSGAVVTVTAKLTDPDGIATVTLRYQCIDPGSYIALADAAYETNWTDLPMHDDGLAGDVQAGDDIYTVQLAGAIQQHRRLVRYRLTAQDAAGHALQVPYADDPQPNFAYFVYDGVPAWHGAVQPGMTEVLEFGPEVMGSLPVYHLISKKADVEASTWLEKYSGSLYKWQGTLIYEGRVYDHIRYRARGGCWRYAMGKNMWKFDFNRGHYFQARDDYGHKYDTTWDKLNFSACIQQGSFGQRGEQGMFEALSFKMFQLAGVPASNTGWVQFRVIDELYEDGEFNAAHPPLTGGGTQYDGDFWGLYMNIEQMDGRFLNEHDLPDGNLYKMEATYGELNNQGPTAATDSSDIRTFKTGYESSPSAAWWGANVDLQGYYSYFAIYQAIQHGDITSKNHFFYLNPELTTNEWGIHYLWQQQPWDVDLTWTTYYGGTNPSDPFSRSGVFGHSTLLIARNNRLREINDLLFHPEQMFPLIDEMAALIDDPDAPLSIADADRAQWDYHWVMAAGAYPTYLSHEASYKAGQGRFYEEAEERGYPRSFAGMVQVMKEFVSARMSHMAALCNDAAIPYTPTISAAVPGSYPLNALTFQCGPFGDPQGSQTFGAVQWRIAEVTDDANPIYAPDEPGKYEITPTWQSALISPYQNTATIPGSVVAAGRSYRVRVRMMDTTGRASHWSEAISFVAQGPLGHPLLGHLRVTEIMYHPAAGMDYEREQYEFIELQNTHESLTLDLTGVSFTKGIRFDFADGDLLSLAPGEFVLLVRNRSAFQSRYGTALAAKIAGEYDGQLDNDGEDLTLVDYMQGTILDFDYQDGWYEITDGLGFSLTVRDPAGTDPNDWDEKDTWRASLAAGGSPGTDDSGFVLPPDAIRVNELLAHAS